MVTRVLKVLKVILVNKVLLVYKVKLVPMETEVHKVSKV